MFFDVFRCINSKANDFFKQVKEVRNAIYINVCMSNSWIVLIILIRTLNEPKSILILNYLLFVTILTIIVRNRVKCFLRAIIFDIFNYVLYFDRHKCDVWNVYGYFCFNLCRFHEWKNEYLYSLFRNKDKYFDLTMAIKCTRWTIKIKSYLLSVIIYLSKNKLGVLVLFVYLYLGCIF